MRHNNRPVSRIEEDILYHIKHDLAIPLDLQMEANAEDVNIEALINAPEGTNI